jgi:hypothetical protein
MTRLLDPETAIGGGEMKTAVQAMAIAVTTLIKGEPLLKHSYEDS